MGKAAHFMKKRMHSPVKSQKTGSASFQRLIRLLAALYLNLVIKDRKSCGRR